jgi:hypothetical protein
LRTDCSHPTTRTRWPTRVATCSDRTRCI